MTHLPVCESIECSYATYAKIMIASSHYVSNEIIERERIDLTAALMEARSAKETEEAVFLEMALQEIDLRRKDFISSLSMRDKPFSILKGTQSPGNISMPSSVTPLPQTDTISFQLPPPALVSQPKSETTVIDPFTDEVKRISIEDQVLDSPVEQLKPTLTVLPKSSPRMPPSKPSNDGFYHFYQAADGQLLFLHPLDIKMLKDEYGSYEKFPDEICVRVCAVEESTLNEVI
jgi:hypothetical protein